MKFTRRTKTDSVMGGMVRMRHWMAAENSHYRVSQSVYCGANKKALPRVWYAEVRVYVEWRDTWNWDVISKHRRRSAAERACIYHERFTQRVKRRRRKEAAR